MTRPPSSCQATADHLRTDASDVSCDAEGGAIFCVESAAVGRDQLVEGCGWFGVVHPSSAL